MPHLPESEIRAWFLQGKLDGNRLVLPTKFAADWVRQKLDQAVRAAFGAVEIAVEAKGGKL